MVQGPSIGLDLTSVPQLSFPSQFRPIKGGSPESNYLLALVMAQKALGSKCEKTAQKAIHFLLLSTDEIPHLQSNALVEILQNMIALQAHRFSA